MTIVIYLLMVDKNYNLKQKTIKCQSKKNMCLGNLSSDWTGSEFDKTGLWGNIYDFVVDYKSIVGTAPIYDMHKYLMTKHNIT